MIKQLNALFAGAVVLSGLSSMAQPVGQWDFNSATLAPTVGTAALDYLTPETQPGVTFGTTTTFGIANIGGAVANVAKVEGWTTPNGLKMPVTADANGGGSLVNQWTYAADILFPAGSDLKWRALLETDGRVIEADAEFFVNGANGLGIAGNYSGKVTPDAWHRIVIAVDMSVNTIYKYIDGVLVGVQSGGNAPAGGPDGRFALSPGGMAELFTDNDGETAPGYVNSIQLYNRALNAGEVASLGGSTAAGLPTTLGPTPAYIESSTPGFGAVDVAYLPEIHVNFNAGASTVPVGSLQLLLDSKPVAATISGTSPAYTLDFTVTEALEPNQAHSVGVVFTENGTKKTNSFSFVVANYQKVTLPEPFLIETFDLVAEGSIPAGWTRTNRTDIIANSNFEDLDNLNSNSYLDWTVISAERAQGLKSRIFNINTVVLNGVVQDTLATGNFVYAESDVRGGNQVQVLFSKDFDLTGKKNVFIAFSSLYEQNQDNINSLEYSIDEGATWLPALYMIDKQDAGGDIKFFPDGSVDAVTSLTIVPGGSAYNLPYGAFIGAPITQALAPYISGRVNDDSRESKRIEVIRLFKADNQPKVRLRFMQAGTASWYWGVDNVGFYSIPEPKIIFSPSPVTVNFDATATFKVTASGDATLAYQWLKDGAPISGATGDTLTLTHVTGASTADYSVVVTNLLGSATSGSARLTVLLSPVIAVAPQPVLASVGAPFALEVEARGQAPFTYQWYKGVDPIDGATGSSFVKTVSVLGDAGDYTVKITNPAGNITTAPVKVTILPQIPITQDLVAHYTFDADANDSSGRANHGTPEVQPEIVDGALPAYTTDLKQIGGGSLRILDGQHIALGQPEDFNFGSDVNFTFSMWIHGTNASAWTGDPSFLGNKNWASGGNVGYTIAAQGSGAWKWNSAGDGGIRRDLGNYPGLADNTFHNVIVSVDRTGLIYIYVDGILRGTQSVVGDGSYDSLPLYIGQDGTGRYGFNNDLGAHFIGVHIDDVGIWRRLITPQEAASIFVNGKAGKDLTQANGQAIILAPTINTQPLGGVVSVGGSITLTATAGGTAPFTYEWKKGATVVGASKSLTLSSVTTAAAGDYTLTVANSAGSIVSSPAKVSVVSGPISDGLVAHLKFDGTYADATGRGNNGTAVGTPTFDAGKFGQAVTTTITADNAGDKYVTLGKPADLNFGESDFSVSMWINYTTATSDPPFVSNKDWDSSSNIGWGIFAQNGGNPRINATGTPRGSGNRYDTSATPSIRDGNWHNVVVSFARGNVTSTYIDGVPVAKGALVITGSVDAGFDVNIGNDGTGSYGGTTMTAKIDDVAFWRRALSAQEAETIAFAPGDISTLSPVTAQLKIAAAVRVGDQLNLTVTGASGTARLEKRDSLSAGAWTDVGPITAGATSITISGNTGFFRIVNP
jgi:hypothetical protein